MINKFLIFFFILREFVDININLNRLWRGGGGVKGRVCELFKDGKLGLK